MRLETLSRIIQQFLLLIVRLFFRNACGTEMLPQTEMLLNLGIYWIVFLHFLCICSNAKWSELNQILKSITFQNGINYLGFCCNLSWWSFSVCNNNVFMQILPTSAFLSNLDYKEHCRCLQRHLNNTFFDISRIFECSFDQSESADCDAEKETFHIYFALICNTLLTVTNRCCETQNARDWAGWQQKLQTWQKPMSYIS